MKKTISPFCVYTIVHSKKLDEKVRTGGKFEFTENKIWAAAARLLKAGEQNDTEMLVIFAPAQNTSELSHYGLLEKIEIKKVGDKAATTFYGSTLTRFRKPRPLKTSLIVNSTGRMLPEGYIRPYVICKTPASLLNKKNHRS